MLHLCNKNNCTDHRGSKKKKDFKNRQPSTITCLHRSWIGQHLIRIKKKKNGVCLVDSINLIDSLNALIISSCHYSAIFLVNLGLCYH